MDKLRFWQHPPAWALLVDHNSDALTRAERREMRHNALVGDVPVAPPCPQLLWMQRRSG